MNFVNVGIYGLTHLNLAIFLHLHWGKQGCLDNDSIFYGSGWFGVRKMVNEFVQRLNNYRSQSFIPSEMICVDESISRWYGQGGDWINFELSHYVDIDRKPENGCEIQNLCCGLSGIG